jgi:cell division septation protein DedD
MTDTRVDDPALEEDRLPWLEAVEEDDEREGPGAAKLIAFVVIGLVAIGLIVGGLFWMGNRETAPEGGEPEVIAAPDGDYKVKPSDPGGMKVEGEGDTAFAASAGADPKGALNVDAVPETPVARQKAAQTAQNTATPPAAAPKAAPAAPKAAEPAPKAEAPAPAPAGGRAAVQLGAFSSEAGANNAWKKMSGRFTYLAPLTHSVTTVTTGGKTLYRLRASGPDAASLCSRLRVAGESCVVVN